MYIFHLNGGLFEETGEIKFFFTCKGGRTFNSCCDTLIHRFFIECSLKQKEEMFNSGTAFFDIFETAKWFLDTFGVEVKPFYTIKEVGFSINKKNDFQDQSKTHFVYFKQSADGNYVILRNEETSNFRAGICKQELYALQAIMDREVFENYFLYAFSAHWWKMYYNITIENLNIPEEKIPKKRGPRGELANLQASGINYPTKRIKSM